MNSSDDATIRRAAKVVGAAYLVAMVAAVFAEFYVRGSLVVANDATATAHNIATHALLWRFGIASSVVCLAVDVALVTALFVILRRVNPSLALFALALRIVETAIGAVATVGSVDVLRLLGDATYLDVFGRDQREVLARLAVASYGSGVNLTFVFLGAGSAVFGWLWYASRLIPRALALLGIVASLAIAAGAFGSIVLPDLGRALSPWYLAPIAVFEIAMGFWLLLRPLRIG